MSFIQKLSVYFFTGILFLQILGCDTGNDPTKLLNPQNMLIEVQSPYNTEATKNKILQNINDLPGWGLVQGEAVSFDAVLNKDWDGLKIDSLYAIEIGNPDYTGTILSEDQNKFASVMMPCVIAIYQKGDGKTYVSYMNARIMGKIFQNFPKIQEYMGSKIAQDQDKMLDFLDLPENDWGESLPGMDEKEMVLDQQSLLGSIEETVDSIRHRVETMEGWEFFKGRDTFTLDEVVKMSVPGKYDDLKKVHLIEICNKDYSRRILGEPENRFVSVMLPCTIAVYEKSDGTIWISRLRTERLGQVWGGTIEDVMGTLVSTDVARIVTGN